MLGYQRCPCAELEELRATKRGNKELKADLMRMGRLNESLRAANITLLGENMKLREAEALFAPVMEAYEAAAECIEIMGGYMDMERVREDTPEDLPGKYERFMERHEQILAMIERERSRHGILQ